MLFFRPFLPIGAKAKKQGFTIIELLIAVSILAIVAGVGVQIFLSVAGSFGKATVLSNLQEEGSRVVNEMARVIRDGQMVEQVTLGDTLSPACPAGNGMIKITLSKQSLEYQTNGNCQIVIFCRIAQDSPPTYNNYIVKKLTSCSGTSGSVGAGELTDKNVYTGIDVADLIFGVSGGVTSPYLVNIQLKLKQALNAPQRNVLKAEIEVKNSAATRNF